MIMHDTPAVSVVVWPDPNHPAYIENGEEQPEATYMARITAGPSDEYPNLAKSSVSLPFAELRRLSAATVMHLAPAGVTGSLLEEMKVKP